MLKNTLANDKDRSIIAGHYVFSSEEFIQIKEEACSRIKNLNNILIESVKDSIFRYMKAFNLT